MRRRAAALAIIFALAAASWAECAGWQATPQARMACCADSSDCPMHGSSEQGAGAERVLTQAQADSCCAASDADDSTPSALPFSLSLSAVLVPSALSMLAPANTPPAPFAAWRTQVPVPLGHVRKHVRLSVFLI